MNVMKGKSMIVIRYVNNVNFGLQHYSEGKPLPLEDTFVKHEPENKYGMMTIKALKVADVHTDSTKAYITRQYRDLFSPNLRRIWQNFTSWLEFT